MFGLKVFLPALVLRRAAAGSVKATEWYGLSTRDIDGSDFSFENLRGVEKVVVTNVASH